MEKKSSVPMRLHLVETGLDLGTGMKEKMSTVETHLTNHPASSVYLIMLCLRTFSCEVLCGLSSMG